MKPDESNVDLLEVISGLTNLIQNERVRAYNEGVDAERERCIMIAEAAAQANLNKENPTPQSSVAQSIANHIRSCDEGTK